MSGNNSSVIFITEKPSVAQEYRKVLKVQSGEKTNGYIEGHSPVMNTNVIITWAVGHLIGICSPEEHNEDWKAWKRESLPMIPHPFQYKPMSGTYDQFKVVKSLYTRKDIDCIYYAGDSGREGIYIQALIRNQIFKSAPRFSEKVVWIDSFTEEAILNGIRDAKPYSAYVPMIDSGYARAIDDWLIGMNLSRAFTLTSGGYGNAIAVGRVMTPTLAMVVKRQQEIDNFTKVSYYGVRASDGKGVKAAWKAVKTSKYFESELLYNDKGFLKKSDAETLIAECSTDNRLTVTGVQQKEAVVYPPQFFNLADLQMFCTRAFGFSPQYTLDTILESLYLKKYITYPRTDARVVSTEEAKHLASIGYDVPQDTKEIARRAEKAGLGSGLSVEMVKIAVDGKNVTIPKPYICDALITDHFAIIPTFSKEATSSLTDEEQKVYNAIVKRFTDVMKMPYIYDSVTVTYKHENGECFIDSFTSDKHLGFRATASADEYESDEEEQSANRRIPNKGEVVPVKFGISEMETKPPSAYTTGSLVIAMEKAGKLIEDGELREQIKSSGIGTSATRASIIQKLVDTNLITTDKKQKVAPTERGKQIIAIVSKYDEALVSPLKTAEMEQQLQAISESSLTREQHESDIAAYLKSTIHNIFTHNTDHIAGAEGKGGAVSGKCPHCGGEVTKGKFGWYCKSKCGMNISKVYGHELTDAQIGKLLSGKEITYTANGRKTTVLPEAVQNDWQGKTYWNWKTKSGGAAKTSGSSAKKSSGSSKAKSSGGWGTWGKG